MKILVTDFDGTLSHRDFYDLVRERWPVPPDADPWEKYVLGEISHFEALRRIFERIPAEEAELLEVIEQMGIPAGLAESLALLYNAGWEVEVASAGCAWYIEKLLRKAGVTLPIHSNPGHFEPGKGLRMRLPEESLYLDRSTGIDKKAVVAAALARAEVVAFAGDGRPDLEPALMVPAERRFARGWLAEALETKGEGFQSFEDWTEIAMRLTSQ